MKLEDRQTMLVYFVWPTKRPGGHQSQLTINQPTFMDVIKIHFKSPCSLFIFYKILQNLRSNISLMASSQIERLFEHS